MALVMLKRGFDVLVSLALLLLLAPLLLALALWIKLDSPGPVLFRQTRVGRGGVAFDIHKFRTMQHGAAGLPLTVGADPRITRAGAWLRQTRLDELPQLLDVLAGSMSLVGPRPEVPRYVVHYPAALRERLLAQRPGLTDPAALHYIDEARVLAAAPDPERAYIEQVLPAKLALSAAYAERATLASDIGVLWRTACALVKKA
jgi:lipopolysaccharide/colanic/teichoic acid biosynthesis glycosyltransferase